MLPFYTSCGETKWGQYRAKIKGGTSVVISFIRGKRRAAMWYTRLFRILIFRVCQGVAQFATPNTNPSIHHKWRFQGSGRHGPQLMTSCQNGWGNGGRGWTGVMSHPRLLYFVNCKRSILMHLHFIESLSFESICQPERSKNQSADKL